MLFFFLAFFICVQLFFTLCFMLMLVGIAGTLMYVLCFTYEHQVKLLRALAWDLTIAGSLVIQCTWCVDLLIPTNFFQLFVGQLLSSPLEPLVIREIGCQISSTTFYRGHLAWLLSEHSASTSQQLYFSLKLKFKRKNKEIRLHKRHFRSSTKCEVICSVDTIVHSVF